MIVKQLSEPWFSLMYSGKKTVEIGLDKDHFHHLKVNDASFNIRRKFCVRVLSIEQFDTWKSLLDKHLSHALPTIKSIEFAEEILKKLFPQFDNYQKLAIHVKRVSTVSNVSKS